MPGDKAAEAAGALPLKDFAVQSAGLHSIIAKAELEADGASTLTVSQEARDRSWIARVIILVFSGSIAGVLVLLLITGLASKEWGAMADHAVDLIKSAVLPVVTLVLGFYFGSRDK